MWKIEEIEREIRNLGEKRCQYQQLHLRRLRLLLPDDEILQFSPFLERERRKEERESLEDYSNGGLDENGALESRNYTERREKGGTAKVRVGGEGTFLQFLFCFSFYWVGIFVNCYYWSFNIPSFNYLWGVGVNIMNCSYSVVGLCKWDGRHGFTMRMVDTVYNEYL